MQGHPEAPGLWSNHIHHILQTIGLTPTSHETCLYSGYVGKEKVYLLRQVDDFAVSASSLGIGNILLSKIDEQLKEPLKYQGIISYFNGVTISQSKDYININCSQYLEREFERHRWTMIGHCTTVKSTPMTYDKRLISEIELTKGPTTEHEAVQLQKEMGFSYRAAIGELVYALITCRPDISYATIK